MRIVIFLILSFIFLTTNIGAYQSCDGEYSPYPVKCVGGGGSVYSGDTAENTQPVNIWLIISIILGITIVWLITKRRR